MKRCEQINFKKNKVELQQSKFHKGENKWPRTRENIKRLYNLFKAGFGEQDRMSGMEICVFRNVRKVGGRKKCSAITIHYGCLNFPNILIEGWLRGTTVVSPGVTHNQMFLSGTITTSCFLQCTNFRNEQRTHQGINTLLRTSKTAPGRRSRAQGAFPFREKTRIP